MIFGLLFAVLALLPLGSARREPVAPASPICVVLVEWHIKAADTAAFETYWAKSATIPDRAGLIAEFASREEDRAKYPYITTPNPPGRVIYRNVGLWQSCDAYHAQIGHRIGPCKLLPFEDDCRVRVLMRPVLWRIGEAPMPLLSHPETE
jgi:hypothetical protein